MPDTAANQERWPQSRRQKPGLGFPLLNGRPLFSLGSGALLEHATGDLHVHESQLWGSLEARDVILADRAFCPYAATASLRRARGEKCHELHASDGAGRSAPDASD